MLTDREGMFRNRVTLEAISCINIAWCKWLTLSYAGDSVTVDTTASSLRWWSVNGIPLLTYSGRDNMASILQTLFRYPFCWMKIVAFRFRFHCNCFSWQQISTGSGNGLVPNIRYAIICTGNSPIYASLGLGVVLCKYPFRGNSCCNRTPWPSKFIHSFQYT